ncbi:MAG: HPr kinase/phosphorylase [Chlamydiae bacterium]|nr:HPr kinase/phosphorylase [Chlamydiota bacterium]
MFLVQEFFEKYQKELSLELVAGQQGLKKRRVKVPEIHRAGLSLTGYLKNYSEKRMLIMGKVEVEFLKSLDSELRRERLSAILSKKTPAVILTRRYKPMKELLDLCNERNLPLFRAPFSTMVMTNQMAMILTEEFAPIASRHGTFVEVFDIGVLIEGDSAIGKSETALGLIERGHRLISDDIVRIKKAKDSNLEGRGVDLTRHHMEIRGIGIINVANLYGAFCVRDKKRIDLIVRLEAWDKQNFYDRIGADEKTCEILGVKVPFSILPVKPGRDVVLLIEAIALNYRLKKMGYHCAKEFKSRLSKKIAANQVNRRPFV